MFTVFVEFIANQAVFLTVARMLLSGYSRIMNTQVTIKGLLSAARNAMRYLFRHIEWLLISGLIVVAVVQYYVRPQSQSLAQVIDSGELRVLITDEPDSQYVFNKQRLGFEYELLDLFAESLDVELTLIVVPYGELFSFLDSGAGDIAVGGILDSPFVRRVAQPSIAWYQAQTTVVYKRGTARPKRMEDLAKESILTSARYYDIEQLKVLNLVDDHRSEYQLLSAVDQGNERFALSTNYRALNAKHYLPYLNRSFILPDRLDVVWALPKRYDQALLEELNGFLQSALDKGVPAQLADDYFRLPPRLSAYDTQAIHQKIADTLPDFEYAFRRAARKGGIDWHLLAAVAYQESRWSNEARSPTGVRGVMQLTQDTAAFLGVDDRMDMSQSISAAARYILFLKTKLPKEIAEPQRTWFAVGAYNIGLKHVRYAYRKARKQGLDYRDWGVVSQLLPDLYGKPFSQGEQAKTYVSRVQIFTDILRFYDLHQRPEMVLSVDAHIAKNRQVTVDEQP